jgi:hypothetical protein
VGVTISSQSGWRMPAYCTRHYRNTAGHSRI